jgi:hypothetical protein
MNFLWQVVEVESVGEVEEAAVAVVITPVSTHPCLGHIKVTPHAAAKFGARSDPAKYLPSQHQK